MSSYAHSSQTPAGWYQDPTSGRQRYWDGVKWTDHFAGGSHVASAPKVSNGLVIAGWICAFLAPLIGIVIGVIVMNQDKANKAGLRITLVAAGVFVFWLLMIMIAAASSSSASAAAVQLVA
jgi:hypothetical protein